MAPYIAVDHIRGLGGEGIERDIGVGVEVFGARNSAVTLAAHPGAIVLTRQGERRSTDYVEWSASANPARWLPRVSFSGKGGRFVDFATGDVVDGLAYVVDVRARPLDRAELSVRRGVTRLGGNPGGGLRLDEAVTEFVGTYFFGARLYLVAHHQMFDTDRRYPAAPHRRSSLTNVQLSWEASRDLTAYFGLRSGGRSKRACRGPWQDQRNLSEDVAHVPLPPMTAALRPQLPGPGSAANRPSMDYRITIPAEPSGEHREAILGPLTAFNAESGYPPDVQFVAVLLHDADGETIGGLWGKTGYGWLFVEFLAVPESLRGRDIGASLMREAERIAIQRGCVGSWLTTFTFQARGFYEKLGYSVFGELEDSPRGNVRIFMRKRFEGGGSPRE